MVQEILIYSPSGQIILDSVDDRSYRSLSVMSSHNITVYISSVNPINFSVGCYLDFKGIRYTIRKKSDIIKRIW